MEASIRGKLKSSFLAWEAEMFTSILPRTSALDQPAFKGSSRLMAMTWKVFGNRSGWGVDPSAFSTRLKAVRVAYGLERGAVKPGDALMLLSKRKEQNGTSIQKARIR